MITDISKKVLKNTLYNITGRLWSISVMLAMTPYIISHVGIERFGVWALVGVLTGYFGLLDFGIGAAFVKHIAEFYARKEYDRINQLINAGFVLYLVFAVFVVAVYLTFASSILRFLNIPLELRQETGFVFLAGVILFGVSNALSSFGALQGGLQRMDISNMVGIALSFPSIIGTVLFLQKGYGLRGLVLNNILIFVLSAIVNISVAVRIFPQLKFNPLACSRRMVSKLMTFGYRMQIAKISGFVASQTDNILISCFLSVGLVSFYQLGNNIILSIMAISTLLVSALMPAFSELEAMGKREKLVNAYLKSTKYLSFFIVPLFVFVFVSAFRIMQTWMGPGYEKAGMVLRVLSAGWLINAIAQIGASTSVAIGKPQIMSRSSLIMVSLNIILSIVFIKIFGFIGVSWGTSIAVNIGTFNFFRELNRALNVSTKNFLGIITPYLAVSFLAVLPVIFLDIIAGKTGLVTGRTSELCFILLSGALFFVLYGVGIYLCKVFDDADIFFFSEHMSFIRRKRTV